MIEHVFGQPDTGKPFVDIRKMFYKALKKAGVERRFTFHGLRHTAASHLLMNGVDLRTVGAILGHKSPMMTQRYAHLSPGHLQDAIAKISFAS